MKNLKIYSACILSFILFGCSSDDKLIDQVFEDVDRGLVLRTVSQAGATVSLFDPSAEFRVTLEVQDAQNGQLLSNIDIFGTFVNDGTPGSEIALGNLSASAFSPGPFGFPRGDYAITLGELLSAFSLGDGDFDNNDSFNLRLVANLTDGRSFTNDANGTVLGGSFFSSPFAYTIKLACIPVSPVPGDYTINIADSYGDGWDGAFLTVTIDGDSTDYTITSGSAGTFNFNVPVGTTSLLIEYTSGNFEEEHTYEIIAPTGETAVEDGPSPATGEVILSICDA